MVSLSHSRQFDAIISDQDDTLVGSEELWPGLDAEFFSRVIGPDGWSTWQPRWLEMRRQGVQMDVMLETLRTTYGVERAVPELKYAREDVMFELYRRDLRALPGAQEILQMAQVLGVPVAVASGMSLRIINTVLEIMGWDHFVRATASTHESQRSKPAPDVFLLAATRLGVEPSRCIVLENDANGYRAAIAAGMACYPIPHTPKQREGLEAISVPKIYGSLHEVIEVIRPLLV